MKYTIRAVAIVFATALLGMFAGGLFGAWAGRNAPEVFIDQHGNENVTVVVDSAELRDSRYENIGRVRGAAAGTVLGGGLGVFAVAVGVVGAWIEARRGK
ncbi:MAG TPA: hypothetical protein VD971_14020 [Phycisphaerales bacterium]|nr:hypothetical protein [Phycisphaerales bacterium]